jgi:hypothetical protein
MVKNEVPRYQGIIRTSLVILKTKLFYRVISRRKVNLSLKGIKQIDDVKIDIITQKVNKIMK